MPLLGRVCRAHVEQALSDAGLSAAAGQPTDPEALRALLAKDVATILITQETAPCLNAATYGALITQALDDLQWLATHLQRDHAAVRIGFDLSDLSGYAYYSSTRFAICGRMT